MELSFACIGGNKCGTTWLYEMLNQHPDINLSLNKEPHYFSKNYDKGEHWYQKNWDRRKSGTKGEFSTSYLYDSNALLQLKKHFAQIKIIIVIRNPIERSISHLRHLLRGHKLGELFGIFKSHPEIINNSLYSKPLDFVLNHFESRKVLIVPFDCICNKPGELLRDVFNFLEVDPSYFPKGVERTIGGGFYTHFPILEKVRYDSYYFFKRLGLYQFLRVIKKSGVTTMIKRVNARPNKQLNHNDIIITKHIRKFKKEFFDDIKKLQMVYPQLNDFYKEWMST